MPGCSLAFRKFGPSPSTNLAFGKRRHPRHDNVESNDHAAHDPETLGVFCAVESEQYSEDDSAKIAHGSYRAAENTVGVRVDVWDEGEIGSVGLMLATKGMLRKTRGREAVPITSFQEESHASDQSKHGGFVLGIEEADGDEEGAGDDTDEDDPAFFQPEVGGDVFVQEVTDYAA